VRGGTDFVARQRTPQAFGGRHLPLADDGLMSFSGRPESGWRCDVRLRHQQVGYSCPRMGAACPDGLAVASATNGEGVMSKTDINGVAGAGAR
jgi:hypothetical protein